MKEILDYILNSPEIRSAVLATITAMIVYLFTLLRNWLLSLTQVQKLLQNKKLIEILKKVVDGYILIVEREHPELSGLEREDLVITKLCDYIKSLGLKNVLSDSELRAIVKTAYESIISKLGQERFDKISEQATTK